MTVPEATDMAIDPNEAQDTSAPHTKAQPPPQNNVEHEHPNNAGADAETPFLEKDLLGEYPTEDADNDEHADSTILSLRALSNFVDPDALTPRKTSFDSINSGRLSTTENATALAFAVLEDPRGTLEAKKAELEQCQRYLRENM